MIDKDSIGVIRIGVYIVYAIYFMGTLIGYIRSDDKIIQFVLTINGAIIVLLVMPPFSTFLERHLTVPEDAANTIVKNYFNKHWIDRFLYAELNPYTSESRPASKRIQSKLKIDCKVTSSATSDKIVSGDICFIYDQLLAAPEDTTNYIIIEGDESSGKTVQCLLLANHALTNKDEKRLPVFLNLFSWAAKGQAIEDWLIEAISYHYDIRKWEARRLLGNPLLLMLDNFEEIEIAYQRHFIDALRQFIKDRPLSKNAAEDEAEGDNIRAGRDKIIICARKPLDEDSLDQYGQYANKTVQQRRYRTNLDELKTLLPSPSVVEIQPLERREIKRYLHKLKYEGFISRKLCHKIISYETLLDIARNPFVLYVTTRLNENENIFNRELCKKNLVDELIKILADRKFEKSMPDPDPDVPIFERDTFLDWIKGIMDEYHLPILYQRNLLFFLEDIDISTLAEKKEDKNRFFNEYRDDVAFSSSIIFAVISLIFFSQLFFSQFQLVPPPLRTYLLVAGTLASFFFGRIYGAKCTGQRGQGRNKLSERVRWHWIPALISGCFWGVFMGGIFYIVTSRIYEKFYVGVDLTHETFVYAIFVAFFFTLIGGLDIGRQHRIVTRPGEGIRFLLAAALMASVALSAFFFAFLLWPRINFVDVASDGFWDFIREAFRIVLLMGTFQGIVSSLVLFHVLIRHYVLRFFLRRRMNFYTSFTQLLSNSVDAGLMGQLGGGYFFRHQKIREYIRQKATEDDHT